MSEGKYNGWTNYETWLVGLWLGNDEATYNYWHGEAEECKRKAAAGLGNPYADSPEQATKLLLSDSLKEQIHNVKDDLLASNKLEASMWADLLSAALSEVNWQEIADHMLQE